MMPPAGVTLATTAEKTARRNAYGVFNVTGDSVIENAIVAPQVLQFANPSCVTITAALVHLGDIPGAAAGLPPDPGEAGKATVAGINSNNDRI